MMTLFIAARAVVYATAFMWVWLWIALQLRPLGREWDAFLPAWVVGPGAVLIVGGIVGVIVCIALFIVRGRGTPAIFDAPRRFVAVGPYRHVRNPMYLSAVAIMAGVGLYARSLAVLLFSAVWFLLIHAFVVLVEEPGLRQRFGGTYAEYLTRVPRWIPRLAASVMLA